MTEKLERPDSAGLKLIDGRKGASSFGSASVSQSNRVPAPNEIAEEITALTERLKVRIAENEGLREKARRTERELRDFRERLGAVSADRARLAAEHESSLQREMALQDSIESLKAENAQISAELERVITSRSWKVTGVFRSTGKALRKIIGA